MTPLLNEYCLNHIFSYLKPHHLINASEVCQFWKLTAARQWRKITKIGHFKYDHNIEGERAEIISDVAYRIITYAAPYIKVVDFYDFNKYKESELLMFGNYLLYYVVGPLKIDTIMEVLIRAHATEVTEVRFHKPPTPELMTIFLMNNKVKTLGYIKSGDYHLHIPTDGIENASVSVYLHDIVQQLTSFNGHFPELKKLELSLTHCGCHKVIDALSKTLPYVIRLKYLHLKMNFRSSMRENLFDDIFRLSQLEKLFLVVFNMSSFHCDVNHFKTIRDNFLTTLRTRCPKIRVVKIDFSLRFKFQSRETWKTFCTLVRFDLSPVEFQSIENLTELIVVFSCPNPDVSVFINDLKKTPKLKELTLKSDGHDISETSQIKVVCDFVCAVTSQGKNILLFPFDRPELSRKLKIEHKIKQSETLHFDFDFHNEEIIFAGVVRFVQRELHEFSCSYLRE